MDSKTYPIIKIDEDYFMVADLNLYSGIEPKENEYEISYFHGDPVLKLIKNYPIDNSLYGHKVLASTRRICLPLIDRYLFLYESTIIEPVSVEINHTLMEDLSYPMERDNGYVKINKVNY